MLLDGDYDCGLAVFIGAYSLFHLHWNKIKRKVPGWATVNFVFFGAGITVIFGLYNGGEFFLHDKQEGTMFDWMYFNVQVPAGATMFFHTCFLYGVCCIQDF